MYLDVQFFGYGCGLVMTGWVCGMVISYILSTLRGLGKMV